MELDIEVFVKYMIGKMLLDPLCGNLQNNKVVEDEYEEWIEYFENSMFE